jgi:multisubunit Na+/H+ antiporter MnhF subunit
VFDVIVSLIALSFFLSFIRFLKGPDFANRVVSFDVMSMIVLSLLVVLSIEFKSSLYLDVAFVFAFIGFIGVIIFARFNRIGESDA